MPGGGAPFGGRGTGPLMTGAGTGVGAGANGATPPFKLLIGVAILYALFRRPILTLDQQTLQTESYNF